MLTQDKLKQHLSYDPETGVFRRLLTQTRRVKVGDIAGTVGKYPKGGYVTIMVDRKVYLAHRLAWLYMKGKWPEGEIDHKDLNRSNNAILNLREATRLGNTQNCKLRKDNKSGVKGVAWNKRRKRWQVHCSVKGVNHMVGVFRTIEEASAARQAFAKEHHGEFYHE